MFAKITLTGPQTWHVGRYAFKKGKTEISDDPKLIDYCQISGHFQVVPINAKAKKEQKVEVAETKPAPKRKVRSRKKTVGTEK